MGCAMGQGYHLGRPLVAELIDKMLAGLAAQAHAAPGLQGFGRQALFH